MFFFRSGLTIQFSISLPVECLLDTIFTPDRRWKSNNCYIVKHPGMMLQYDSYSLQDNVLLLQDRTWNWEEPSLRSSQNQLDSLFFFLFWNNYSPLQRFNIENMSLFPWEMFKFDPYFSCSIWYAPQGNKIPFPRIKISLTSEDNKEITQIHNFPEDGR